MMQLTPDWIGWLATAIFLVSYSCKNQGKLPPPGSGRWRSRPKPGSAA